MLSGHLDTVPVDEAAWKVPAWEGSSGMDGCTVAARWI